MGLAWPVRSVIAGFAGKAASSLAYRREHVLRPDVHGQFGVTMFRHVGEAGPGAGDPPVAGNGRWHEPWIAT